MLSQPADLGVACGFEWNGIVYVYAHFGKKHECNQVAGHLTDHVCKCGARTQGVTKS